MSQAFNRIRKTKRMKPVILYRNPTPFHVHPRSLANPMKRGNDGATAEQAIINAKAEIAKR